MKQQTVVDNLSFEQLAEMFAKIQNEIADLKNNYEPKKLPEYLTTSETMAFFKISRATLHNWTQSGVLNSYGVSGRVYYLRSEVEAAPIKLRNTDQA